MRTSPQLPVARNKLMLPILYSFRRCPYAMRARLAIAVSGLEVEHREILLKNKPASMLDYSPKGTVPVLILDSGEVIDESLDIMFWALKKNDPEGCLFPDDRECVKTIMGLIHENDFEFKPYLDRYKYADRYPEQAVEYYREQGESFIAKLESLLADQGYLEGGQFSFADLAIAPFIRQFAHVDREWFYQTPYSNVRAWLDEFLESKLFLSIMKKHKPWSDT